MLVLAPEQSFVGTQVYPALAAASLAKLHPRVTPTLLPEELGPASELGQAIQWLH